MTPRDAERIAKWREIIFADQRRHFLSGFERLRAMKELCRAGDEIACIEFNKAFTAFSKSAADGHDSIALSYIRRLGR